MVKADVSLIEFLIDQLHFALNEVIASGQMWLVVARLALLLIVAHGASQRSLHRGFLAEHRAASTMELEHQDHNKGSSEQPITDATTPLELIAWIQQMQHQVHDLSYRVGQMRVHLFRLQDSVGLIGMKLFNVTERMSSDEEKMTRQNASLQVLIDDRPRMEEEVEDINKRVNATSELLRPLEHLGVSITSDFTSVNGSTPKAERVQELENKARFLLPDGIAGRMIDNLGMGYEHYAHDVEILVAHTLKAHFRGAAEEHQRAWHSLVRNVSEKVNDSNAFEVPVTTTESPSHTSDANATFNANETLDVS